MRFADLHLLLPCPAKEKQNLAFLGQKLIDKSEDGKSQRNAVRRRAERCKRVPKSADSIGRATAVRLRCLGTRSKCEPANF